MKALLNLFEGIKVRFLAMSAPQKIFYAGTVAVLIGSLIFLVYTVNKVEYSPLNSRLSEEDLAVVVETLKSKKISYQLSGGNGIMVPKDQLPEVRLALASAGVLKGSGVGFEIFDQQKLGSTEFVQRINYQRALQGELSRTINRMDEVQESRVHLVLPTESLFIEDKKPTSAAVVLKLRPGARIEPNRVQGIVNLVCSAVQGLQDDKVSILSTDGQVLFKKGASDSPLQLSGLQMQFRNNLEEDLSRKVQSLLDQVVGVNKAKTRVTVDLDFNQMQITEDIYDPDSAVIRSQQRSIENSQGGEIGAKGNPDVPLNVESQLMQTPPPQPQPGQPVQQAQQGREKTANRQRETVNYEINRVSRQTTHAPGNVKKLSVAVLVDGPYEMKPDKDGKPVSVFVGRTAEQLKSLEDIVKKAVGYNEGRGDQINVSNIPFATETAESEFVKAENQWVKLLKENQRLILNLVLAILAFMFVIRPFMRKFQKLADMPAQLPGHSTGALPPGEEDYLELMPPQPEGQPSLRKQTMVLVRRKPEHAAEVIRSMLREES
ncbi:MAG: flagellar basal-body MS-ring/collar protein FliF [Syntrophobacteraceae bacterium]